MLSYPECCVRASIEESLALYRAFLGALIAKVGDDPVSVERAIRDNVQVEPPDGTEMGAMFPRPRSSFRSSSTLPVTLASQPEISLGEAQRNIPIVYPGSGLRRSARRLPSVVQSGRPRTGQKQRKMTAIHSSLDANGRGSFPGTGKRRLARMRSSKIRF